MNAYMDILFWLLVVIVIVVRLRSLLGTRPDNQKVIILSKDRINELVNVLKEEVPTAEILPLNGVDAVLAQIPDFNKEAFLAGAKRAFEGIVCAFADADMKMLEALTTKRIYKKFAEIIEERKSTGQTAETDFIGFDKAEIVDAKLTKTLAKIVVSFVSEQVNILRDKNGEVVRGDENFVQKISDVWTFERDIRAKNGVWFLASTKK